MDWLAKLAASSGQTMPGDLVSPSVVYAPVRQYSQPEGAPVAWGTLGLAAGLLLGFIVWSKR